MKILDCETRETTYACLEKILEVDRKSIDATFDALDIEKFFEDNPASSIQADDLVFSRVCTKPLSDISFDRVCWFHLTRLPMSNSLFANGILPLNQAIDFIWDFLYSLVEHRLSKQEWSEFRRTLAPNHHAWLYRSKVNDPLHWGPHAILIREIVFRSQEVGNHDYLRTPEIVEDICRCFDEKHGLDLLEIYSANSRPCIVKFSDDDVRNDYVTKALYYLYDCHHGNELSLDDNTCFDNRGKLIPSERILKVEWL